MFNLHAQTSTTTAPKISIGGNVYGGGNEGDTQGNTNVIVRTGTIKNVFGGARMADVGGRAFVNIDGENGSGVILISAIYGGNDISGTVGANVNPNDTGIDEVPAALTDVIRGTETEEQKKGKNKIDNSWVAFVRSSPMHTEGQGVEDDTHCILVGSVYGGGNGDYTYTDASGNPLQNSEGKYIAMSGNDTIATSTTRFSAPTLTKTYLEINGGCLSQVYGGGNNATVTQKTTISMNNPSKGLQSLFPGRDTYASDSAYQAALMQQLLFLSKYTGISTFQGNFSSLDYTSSRVFGGNNKAEMKIMPTWNLQKGLIRDLYSGGNEGNMTSEFGLLLEIDPVGPDKDSLYVLNVYGGCRRADVDPKNSSGQTPTTIQLPTDEQYSSYKFPAGLSARTIIRGGHIVNVYGGNDISGRVFGGDAIGVYSTVYGDVYGGGNGSYSYTDNAMLGVQPGFADFYYNPDSVRVKEQRYNNPNFDYSSADAAVQSVEALNIFRPNAEQVSILVRGTDADHPTIIRGSVYLGGNSATLKHKEGATNPLVELKIGSHVIVDKVYLGNNGENMVTEDILKLYAQYVNTSTGATETTGTSANDYSQLTLTVDSIFAKYMDGCAMEIHPRVVFEQTGNGDPYDYENYSSYFGSFYCGGNRGSMTWPGTNTITFNKNVIIYDKFVGGCNNANIEETAYNAYYGGGMIGSIDEQSPMGMKNQDGSIRDCMILNLSGLRIMPKRWKKDSNGDDILDANGNPQLEWNTFCYTDGDDDQVDSTDINRTIHRDDPADQHEFDRRLRGGNIYGGCYVSGHMNGNVVINLLDDIIDKDDVFDIVTKPNATLYGNDEYTITKRNSGVILDEQGMDPLGMALNVFGAGYGADSEVWGSCTVNHRNGFTFQIFGGGEKGVIGQSREDFAGTSLGTIQTESDYLFNGKHYFYDPRFSANVNVQDEDKTPGGPSNDLVETVFIYGGSFEAPIAGNTYIHLGDGRTFNTFAGSCNADILGHTETYVGLAYDMDGTTLINGFPYVTDHIYGGNDLGGRILGEKRAELYPSAADAQQALADCRFAGRLTANGQDLTKVYKYDSSSNPNPSSLTASAYIEYIQGHAINIFGGAYGDYDYTDPKYDDYCYTCNRDASGNITSYSDGANASNLGSNKNGFSKPRLGNAFINFKPIVNSASSVAQLYGAGQGQHYVYDRDVMQERSYILIDIPQTIQEFRTTAAFGAGAYCGLGMEKIVANKTAEELDTLSVGQQNAYYARLDSVSAVIDLAKGQIKNVYGGSYNEGVTRRTVVNVPAGSTIVMTQQKDSLGVNIANSGCIFGGAFGEDISYPCDVIESHVNYSSNKATVQGGIFGGNNNARRTLFTNVEINDTVWSNKTQGYQGYVYGAGYGADTWAHYTDVNLNDHAMVYKLYGGGSNGHVLNEPSLNAWAAEKTAASETFDLTLGDNYTGNGYTVNFDQNALAPWNVLADDTETGIVIDRGKGREKYNTNVNIYTGAIVTGYAYGGGYGTQAVVSGDTYISLQGGQVQKDIYAAGESGPVMCLYPAAQSYFRACANAYIRGGRVRNVYGGGWKGDVGYHNTATLAIANDDIEGITNVVVGTLTGTCLNDGIPAVERSVYGGGEGGSIFGTTNVSINNGYIGYRFDGSDPTTFQASDYAEELDDWDNNDPEKRKNGLLNSGNVFGGGYVANSYTENSNVHVYNGMVRGSVYGGGEIGIIGRGTVKTVSGEVPIVNANANIFKPGTANVYILGGQINRNVFGGGRGYDNWGGNGTELYKDQPDILAQMDLESKGFVFGQTKVHIHGGTVGTPDNVAQGYGNVFGGGDIGFVYSGYGKRLGTRGEALSTSNGLPVNGGGYYYKYYNEDLTHVANDNAAIALGMTTDCSVEVAPYCKVLPGKSVTLPKLLTDANGDFVLDANGLPTKDSGEQTFNEGEYVPYEYLNLLKNKNSDSDKWACLDLTGVTIRNAVFAGGNVSTGSDQIFVNTNTIYGNVTASLRDVYHRDLITVGTEHTGGLYGDGNLTFVDGFRELHISNYGTDFYGMSEKITKDEYDGLTDRERAYFELEYECIADCTDKNDNTHTVGQTISATEFARLFEGTSYINADGTPNESYWKQMGVCTIYAGRLLNTIQRADYAGVWGSRLVLQGARDRVPEVADYTEYTVNRVSEVSLNKMVTQISGDTGDDVSHGNYFGIYNIVNYLGNLTSDNYFSNVRTTSTTNSTLAADGSTTYYEWKYAKPTDRYRNNATSWNKVALASGVYLELINEPTGGSTEKDWGYITGVIELDLINVKTGLGGGYVYAKNEHGVATPHTDWDKVTLNPYNVKGETFRRFTYDTSDATKAQIETSGNFVHNVKQIVDDCYPTRNAYSGSAASPAHYWYIKGSIYVYDQYISAYTGSATAYSETVAIPLSIQAGAHGRLTLRDVQPSLYAYYDKNGNKLGSENGDETLEINGKHYVLNEPITYWDYEMLTTAQQGGFVPETYTVVEKCMLNGVEYDKGYTILPSDYETMKNYEAMAYDADNDTYVTNADKPATYFLRPSNNVSHDTGYVLTFDIDNPMVWNNYYTKTTDLSDKVNTDEYAKGQKENGTTIIPGEYTQGPTYHLNASVAGVYGQRYYEVNDIIDNTIVDTYPYSGLSEAELEANGQAKFEEAWVTTQAINVNGATINPGVAIVQSEYQSIWGTTIKPNVNVVQAKLITSTLQLSASKYLYAGDVMSEEGIKEQILDANPGWTDAQVNEFYANNSSYVANAYYCTRAGDYGGKTYQPNTSYEVTEAFGAMSAEDRANFRYNYDALDLLIDPTYGGYYGYKPQYDGYMPGSDQADVLSGTAAAQYAGCIPNNLPIYSETTAIDYQAIYNGTTALTYNNGTTDVTISPNDTINRKAYEAIPNERYHYSPITVTSPGDYYVVREAFIRGDLPYTAGEVITKAQYDALDDNQQKPKVDVLTFSAAQAGTATTTDYTDAEGNPATDDRGFDKVYTTVTYYYCRDPYTIGERGEGQPVTDIWSNTVYNVNQKVDLATVINSANYTNLVNKTVDNDHQLFSIIGNVPTETSTLYVARQSDINDLTKEKVITVIFLYEYEESDESGMNIMPISERHIVNIHLQFKSGVPQIGQLSKPNTVLPGSTVGMKVPEVTTGAFEVLSSGWEVFANKEDAAAHKNGTPFVNNNTRVYWYQDDYQIAYYTKTYLGKTYSNYVPLSVGNYHDIADVMADSVNHMFIDHKDAQKYQRGPKIYLDNRNNTGVNTDKSELDMLKDLFDLTLFPKNDDHGDPLPAITDVQNAELNGHHRLDEEQIGATKNLEFFLRADLTPTKYTDWTPIGEETQDGTTGKFTQCFEGTLHGDGYTISGLNNSLFKSLCGEIYNLGVTGTFTSAGIVETGTGYIENCWIKSDDNNTKTAKPLFNTPARNSSMEGGKYAGKLIQVVNSYYPEENQYTDHAANAAYGKATEKPLQSFYNGEVAYDLNGFYLNKRYYDHTSDTGYDYEYLDTHDLDSSNKPTVKEEHYPETDHFDYEYVSNRYSNVDFTFAGGTVPSSDDQRLVVDTINNKSYYCPIWPDDYLFFGQKLTYGYVDGHPHQNTPAYIVKSNTRLETDGTNSNRVYRAPAYFQSSVMNMAYYNPQAIFADHKNGDVNMPVHRNMTAIDFTGSNGDVAGGYKEGRQTNGHFFPPLLDLDGITALRNEGLTKNWLVYTPNATTDGETNQVVLDYLREYDFASNVTNATYRSVASQDADYQQIHGHAVVKLGENSFSAPTDRDHFLVDRQDFNAPIAYNIAEGHRMWHQRRPDTYVDRTKGWEGISLPFSAELVATQQKGEITHFYGGSKDSYNQTGTKIGHEYWLREFKEGGATNGNIYEAKFDYPTAQPDWATGEDKEYTNTFLWDYYYRYNSSPRLDNNEDVYQQDYYKEAKTFKDYAYADIAKPYIIGFPGTTYYEFDLSGVWKASYSAEEIGRLSKQVITFASHEASSSKPLVINVSDDELASAVVTADGYTFVPNYLGKTLDPVNGTDNYYVMQADGSSYKKMASDTLSVPFRPFFKAVKPSPSRQNRVAEHITFSYTTGIGDEQDLMPNSENLTEGLNIYARRGKIIVESYRKTEATVRILTTNGITVNTFAIQPGETIQTPIHATGIYIANGKKLRVEGQ